MRIVNAARWRQAWERLKRDERRARAASGSVRCGAKTRAGTPCRRFAVHEDGIPRNGRCRLHGGVSTGPRGASAAESRPTLADILAS